MANFELMIPFVLGWETGVVMKDGESNAQLFARAKKDGFAYDHADAGGATMCGVIYTTYKSYRLGKGFGVPTIADLKNITYAEWLEILKKNFWDKWKADQIKEQSVANMLVDFTWLSGKNGITIPQKLLGVTADGIVGNKTLAALNAQDPKEFFDKLYNRRIKYIDDICITRPLNNRFKKGWLNRLNAVKYGSLICNGNKVIKF